MIAKFLLVTAAVAVKKPAIIKPTGKFLTPHGIKNKIPDNKLVPVQILKRISNNNTVNAAAIKG